MKKILFFAVLITALCLYITSYALDEKYKNIKVGLSYGDSAPSSAVLESPAGFITGTSDSTGFTAAETLSCTSLTISSADNGAVNILLPDGTAKSALSSENQIFTVYPSDGNISVNGEKYRGAAMFLSFTPNSLTVINFLPLEEYLYGVISSEMPSSWNIEALKAQAVCARSFAVTNWSKHSSYGFNVCKTTNCQVYGGIAAETASSVQAADETRNKILMYDGSVAQTLFFSTSGGYTADVKNVWGTAVAYLCGVEDPYENPAEASRHSWSATLTNEDIKNALAKLDINIGNITNVSALTDNTTHVYQLDITGTDGSYTLKNQSVCSVFSAFGVQSQKYTVTPYGGSGTNLYAISSAETASLASYNTISAKGTVEKISVPEALISSSGITAYSPGSAEGYIFNGGGWGHGVGMSQYGAKGMADNGFTYDKILYHYYPGTYLE